MPKRFQRRRNKSPGMPKGAVYVGRPTKWGNPFKASGPVLYGPHGLRITYKNHFEATLGAVNLYRAYLLNDGSQPGQIRDDGGAFILQMAREVLAGKDLACWCPLSQPCHANVLLELVNSNGI